MGGGIGERDGGQRERRGGHRSLYAPRPGFVMMRVEAEELEDPDSSSDGEEAWDDDQKPLDESSCSMFLIPRLRL